MSSSSSVGDDDRAIEIDRSISVIRILVREELKTTTIEEDGSRCWMVDGGGDAASEHGTGAGLHHGRAPPVQAGSQRGHGALRPPRLPQPHRRHRRRSLCLLL